MVHEIVIPVMDQASESVLLANWRKAEGEAVQKGEVVCEIETEKALVEIEAAAAGVLRKLLVEAGVRVPPRTVVGLIAEAGEALPDLAQYQPAPPGSPPPAAGGRMIVSPRARRLAEANGLDLATVRGTGPEGRIQEDDVQRTMAAAKVPARQVGRAKAERVSLSWRTIPHFYTTVTVDMSATAARKARAGQGVTYTDLIALALRDVLAQFPALNGHWKDDGLVAVPEIRLGLVVQTERGLMIATLPDLRGQSLESLAAARERVLGQAHAGKFEGVPAEPTFSLSNIGGGHIDHFTAIISPPQVAILSAGSVQRRPVVAGDAVVVRPVAAFTLGVDHRAIDGREAAAFLEALKAVLEAE